MESYSNEEKVRFDLWYNECNDDYAAFTRKVHMQLGKHTRIPANSSVKRWISQFREEGSVQSKHPTGRPISARTEENIQSVSEIIANEPGTSIRRITSEIGIVKVKAKGFLH